MNHEFISSNLTFTHVEEAIRYYQIIGLGGTGSLFINLKQSGFCLRVGSCEEFIYKFIEWICINKNEVISRTLRPILDWFNWHLTDDNPVTLKGRTYKSVLKDVENWHQFLASEKLNKQIVWLSSQFSSFQEDSWSISEILNSKDLHKLGSEQNHCVYSYETKIVSKQISIWALKQNKDSVLTIEVVNKSKTIVQVRGKFNRLPFQDEMQFLVKWAKLNNFSFSVPEIRVPFL